MLRLITLILLLPVWATSHAAGVQPTAPAPDPLETRLEALREKHGLPAIGAAILREGALQLAVVGVKEEGSGTRAAADDGWHIGSCTKAMTATLAGRLVEQGKIDWDTTIAEALPMIADEILEEHRDVTLRQLLGNRSGIGGQAVEFFLFPQLWGIENEMAEQPMRQRRLEAARRMVRVPSKSEVGAFNYSNFGYILAGAMLEAAGDDDWEELMRREVFEPLGMTTAGFGPPEKICGHIRQDDKWHPQRRDNPPVLGPAGTVHCSLEDWSKFAAAHLGEVEGYLKPETLAMLHEPLPGEGPKYALGWGVQQAPDGRTVLTHAGSNTMWFAVIAVDLTGKQVRLLTMNAPAEAAAGEGMKLLSE